MAAFMDLVLELLQTNTLLISNSDSGISDLSTNEAIKKDSLLDLGPRMVL
jgi:hypothetical protein